MPNCRNCLRNEPDREYGTFTAGMDGEPDSYEQVILCRPCASRFGLHGQFKPGRAFEPMRSDVTFLSKDFPKFSVRWTFNLATRESRIEVLDEAGNRVDPTPLFNIEVTISSPGVD